MLTDQQTDQLVQDIQREFPTLTVRRQTYQWSGDYVVIVQDPRNQNEVRITSLRSNWRKKVAQMSAMSKPNQAGRP